MSRSPSERRGDGDAPPPNLRETVEIVPHAEHRVWDRLQCDCAS